MQKLLVLLIFISLFTETKAQELKRLTINNTNDGDVSIYKNKVVWANHGDGYSDIFLAENDTIRQITYGSNYNSWPDIGSKYIVWVRSNTDHLSAAAEKVLIYYDGFEEKQLDNGSISGVQTNGKYIYWSKYTDVTIENWNVQLIVFDGEATKVIAESNKRNQITVAQFTDSGILYLEHDTLTDVARLVNYNFDQRTVLDSIVNGDFTSRNYFYYYNSKKLSKPFFLYYAFNRNVAGWKMKSYSNGKITELPDILMQNNNHLIVDANEDFFTIVAQNNWLIPDSTVLKIWKGNKLFTVSKYPFTEINHYPELNDITTFFSVHDSFGWSNLYLFQNNKITSLSPGHFYIGWQYYSIYGKSIAVSLSPERFSNEKYEVYYYCGEDSCMNAIPLQEFKAKMYYKDKAKNIAVEIETPQAEKFSLEVYDLLGRKVTSTNFVSLYGKFTFLFPIESIKQGMYIVKLQNPAKPQQRLTQKIFFSN